MLHEWMKQGFVELQDEFGEATYFALTDVGLGFSDYIGPKLISEEVNKAMHEWETIYGQTYDFISRKS